MTTFIYHKPPIDLGIGIHDNFKCLKVSLIFFDAIIERSESNGIKYLIGIGIPFWKAFVIHNHNLKNGSNGKTK